MPAAVRLAIRDDCSARERTLFSLGTLGQGWPLISGWLLAITLGSCGTAGGSSDGEDTEIEDPPAGVDTDISSEGPVADADIEDDSVGVDTALDGEVDLDSDPDPELAIPRLDPAFGMGGIAEVVLGEESQARAIAVAIDDDGAIIVAGSYTTDATGIDTLAARFHGNGVIDDSFADEGIAIVRLSLESDEAFALAIQPDGKAVLGGRARPNEGGTSRIAMTRLNRDGSLDESFASGGTFTPRFETETTGDRIDAVLLQSDGRILAVGGIDPGAWWDGVLIRLNADGSPDEAYGEGGVVVHTETARFFDAVLQPDDGKVVVSTVFTRGAPHSFTPGGALLRFNPDGSLDGSFGTDGVGTISGPPSAGLAHVALQPDGGLIAVGGLSEDEDGDAVSTVVYRFTATGQLDTTFGAGGIVILNVSPQDFPNDVDIDQEGRILILGESWGGLGASNEPHRGYLARLLRDGSRDVDFGDNGIFTVGVDLEAVEPLDLAIQPDGNAVVVGSRIGTPTTMLIARYIL